MNKMLLEATVHGQFLLSLIQLFKPFLEQANIPANYLPLADSENS